MSSFNVDCTVMTLPQLQVAFISLYSGWISLSIMTSESQKIRSRTITDKNCKANANIILENLK